MLNFIQLPQAFQSSFHRDSFIFMFFINYVYQIKIIYAYKYIESFIFHYNNDSAAIDFLIQLVMSLVLETLEILP